MSIQRPILKQELVKKLYPYSISNKSAMEQLRKEINSSPTLKEALLQAGNHRRHYYNRKQLELILEHFCISLEEFQQL